MKSAVLLILVAGLFAAIPTSGTVLVVDASVESVSCGEGIHTFTGSHRGEIRDLSPNHQNMTWGTNGSMRKCGLFGWYLGTSCNVDGNTTTTKVLACQTQTDYICNRAAIIAHSEAAVGSLFRTDDSPCYMPSNCENPALTTEDPAVGGEEIDALLTPATPD